ncbi:MAG: hypothetical protein HQK72_17295 [Desulfamplus sp.]|nr:hypothetical protein [Desulfamplus sp.]
MNMNSFTLYGILMCIGACLSFLFESLSGLMNRPEWSTIYLGDISYDVWVLISDKLPVGAIQDSFDYLVFELPLWILFVALGTVCLIIGSFIKE